MGNRAGSIPALGTRASYGLIRFATTLLIGICAVLSLSKSSITTLALDFVLKIKYINNKGQATDLNSRYHSKQANCLESKRKGGALAMIIVPVKEGENIERAIKKFKRKFDKTGVVKELRRRQQFDKPSELKRIKMAHAKYVQSLHAHDDM